MVLKSVYNVTEKGLELILEKKVDYPITPEEFLDEFRSNFELRLLEQPSPNELILEFLHADPSFINALRRILLAEVPTVALEHVYMWNNTSIIHDEVLAHRLGLIPLDVDARLLDEPDPEDDSPTDRNTVVFRLAVSCPSKPPAAVSASKKKKAPTAAAVGKSSSQQDERAVGADDGEVAAASAIEGVEEAATAGKTLQFPKDRPFTKHVYSKDLVWVPQGDQQERFANAGCRPIKPIHDDILIAKLRPGQAIELEAHGRRGIGKDHAKYSPVATASYRLMPHIEVLEPIYDELAEELVHIYEPGVFDLVKTDPAVDPPNTRVKAKLVNPYACTMSRNFMRNPQLEKSIKMTRIADHFIFSVESVGMYSPAVLVAEALRILQAKCQKLSDLIDESQEQMEM